MQKREGGRGVLGERDTERERQGSGWPGRTERRQREDGGGRGTGEAEEYAKLFGDKRGGWGEWSEWGGGCGDQTGKELGFSAHHDHRRTSREDGERGGGGAGTEVNDGPE